MLSGVQTLPSPPPNHRFYRRHDSTETPPQLPVSRNENFFFFFVPRRYGFIANVLFWNASNETRSYASNGRRRVAAELVTPLIIQPANRTHRPNVVLTMTINTKQPTTHEQFIFIVIFRLRIHARVLLL